MLNLGELDLPHLPMEEPSFAADPFPHFTAARARHPWLAHSVFGFVVTEYDAMRDIMRQDDKLCLSNEDVFAILGLNDTSPLRRWLTEDAFSAPRDEHRRFRAPLAASFTPRHANELRPLMRQTITSLLDEWVPRGSFDFGDFASWFPIAIMFDMLRAPRERLAESRADLETLGLLFGLDRTLVPEFEAAVVRIDALAHEVIAAARNGRPADQPPDLIDVLIAANADGGVSDRQFADLIISFFMAANDSAKNMLTFVMHLMIDRAEVYRRCGENADYCRRVIEEAIRYQSTATAMRTVPADLTYREVLLPAGTVLLFPLSVAGRDLGAFPGGDSFDPDSPTNSHSRHIAFGLGQHMCIGQFIARAELQEALHLIAQRIREPKRAGPSSWRPFPGIWGMKDLPITFTPA